MSTARNETAGEQFGSGWEDGSGGLHRRLPPANGTTSCGRIVKSATIGALLFVIVLFPPDLFYRVTAVGKVLIDDVVTGSTG